MLVRPLEVTSTPDMTRLLTAELAPRTPGLHVSQIYQHIMRSIAPEKYKDEWDEQSDAYALMGHAWEDLVGLVMGHQIRGEYGWIRAAEMKMDGVLLTPDWLWMAPKRGPVVVDTKATWKSCRDCDDGGAFLNDVRFVAWKMQLLAYAHALDINHAELYVYFVIGDYQAGPKPQRKRWALEFTRAERVENWQMLLNTARREGWL